MENSMENMHTDVGGVKGYLIQKKKNSACNV